MKTIGVVIPIYNVEKYLRECLDSVINQSYTNLEIILVNDGSTDENSLNIAKEYTLKDKRIALFDKKNGGLSSARNVGIEYFSGEYKLKNKTQTIKENSLIEFNIEGNNPYEIYTVYKSYKAFNNEKDLTKFTYPIIDYIIFLDSDDYWELSCIEECVPRMDGVDVVWFDHFYYYDNIAQQKRNTLIENCGFYNNKTLDTIDFFYHLLRIRRKSFWFSVMGMIDFAFLKSIQLKFLDGIVHEDHYFGKILFFHAKKIFILVDKIYYYRIRAKSIMNYSEYSDDIDIPEFMRDVYSFIQDNTVSRKCFRHYSLFMTAGMIFLFLKYNKNSQKKYLLQDVFGDKLSLWQKEFLFGFSSKDVSYLLSRKISFDDGCTPKILHEILYDFIERQKMQIDSLQRANVEIENRVKAHLSYQIGRVLVESFKNWRKGGVLKLPYELYTIYINFRKKKR
ncbi:glycosyltransferase family 2 protein [Campylobacter coli]